MSNVVVPDEFKKHFEVRSSLSVEGAPKNLHFIWTAHPTTSPAAAQKFNEYISMGFRPVRPQPKESAFGVGVTSDYDKFTRGEGSYVFLTAFSVDNAGYVTTPAKDAILLVAPKELADQVRKDLQSEITNVLRRHMGSGRTPTGGVFAGRTVETTLQEAETAARAAAAEAEAEEAKLMQTEVKENG